MATPGISLSLTRDVRDQRRLRQPRWALLVLVLAMAWLIPSVHAFAAPMKPVNPAAGSLVGLHVSVGFDNSFRPLTWVPVRVTAHNRTAGAISGLLEIPDLTTTSQGRAYDAAYRAMYQSPLVLPGNATRHVNMYMPAESVNGQVTVQLSVGNHVVSGAYTNPVALPQSAITIGALTSTGARIAWLNRISPSSEETVSVIPLSAGTTDPVPQVLANFDIIVVNDRAVRSLTGAQIAALTQYVQNGGALVLVGGPGSQEALRLLPGDLVPGRLTGTTTLSNLHGLMSIGKVLQPPRHQPPAQVSVLAHPVGTVLASQNGIPLVVQDSVGAGNVLYLAFNPSLEPIVQWPSAGSILTTLLENLAPQRLGQLTSSFYPGQLPTKFSNQYGPSLNIAGELDNVPSVALPSTLTFIALMLLYVLFLGPVSFLALRRFRRQGLLWATVPLGAILCTGATFGVAYALKSRTAVVNTIGMVTLRSGTTQQTAQLYMGLFAPIPGDYQLTLNDFAFPQAVPATGYYFGASNPATHTWGLRFQQGPRTQVQFIDMKAWSMRNAAVTTTVHVSGNVTSDLHVNRQGYIVGWIHNGTSLYLQRAAVVAGRAVVHLRDLRPGATVSVRVKPSLSIYSQENTYVWQQVYGQSRYDFNNCCGLFYDSLVLEQSAGSAGELMVRDIAYNQSNGMGTIAYNGPPNPSEGSLNERIRNAVNQIPEAQDVTSLGEVIFVGWSQQDLGSITVDGAVPQRRNLDLVAKPLSIHLVRGPFRLRTGTFGATLTNVNPGPTNAASCCYNTEQGIIQVGQAGSATFQFHLPQPGRIHFKNLWLNVYAGGANGRNMGRVWDWQNSRWIRYDLTLGYARLSDPDRFISPAGIIEIKLVNLPYENNYGNTTPRYDGYTGPILIRDVHAQLQISGSGSVQ